MIIQVQYFHVVVLALSAAATTGTPSESNFSFIISNTTMIGEVLCVG